VYLLAGASLRMSEMLSAGSRTLPDVLPDGGRLPRSLRAVINRTQQESVVFAVPGYAFHFEVLKAANPSLLAVQPQACALGAMGPDIFRFLPPSQALVAALAPGGTLSGSNMALIQQAMANFSSLTPAQLIQLEVLAPKAVPLLLELWAKPIATTYAALLGSNGLDVATTWPLLNQISQLLATLNSIVQDQNELALAGQIGNVTGMSSSLSSLQSLSGNLTNLITTLGFIPALGPWMEEPLLAGLNQLDPALPALPSQDDQSGCRLWEFLRWHHSGQFARNLADLAKTPSQRAFAQGWLCHVATSVTSEPFIANITGGPYRTHWWRNMFVRNYVDSWMFGLAETPGSMSGDTPTPAYAGWKALTAANLQSEFNIAGALSVPSPTSGVPAAVTALTSGDLSTILATLPSGLQEISDLFDEALAATYGPAELAQIGASSLPSVGATFTPGVLKSAYVGAFAVYWFMTSGTGPFNNNLLATPPAGCGTSAPSWMTSGGSPSPSQAGLNTGGAVCAAVFIILALLALLSGDLPAALAALGAAMAAPVVDWSTVACNLFWATNTLLADENALRDILVYLALAYPAPVLLGGTDVNGNTQPATDLSPDPNLQQAPSQPTGNVAPTQGVPLTRSNSLRPGQDPDLYPAAIDTSVQNLADLDWLFYPFPPVTPTAGAPSEPSVPTETAPTDDLIKAGSYADTVFAAPLANGGIIGAGGSFPTLGQPLGGAVANAREALASPGKLADFNLDADRGYGWLGWHPASGSDPTTLPVNVQRDA
jgi:hypothetical protein